MSSRKKCCVKECDTYNMRQHSLSFHSLPTDPVMRRRWIINIGREDLLNKPDLKSKSYEVCSKHFDESMLYERLIRKLKPNAIPVRQIPSAPHRSSSSEDEDESIFFNSSLSSSHRGGSTKIDNSEPNIQIHKIKTENPDEETGAQPNAAVSEDAPEKRKLSIDLYEGERKKKKLKSQLDKVKVEIEAKKSLTLEALGDNDGHITKRFHKLLEWKLNLKSRYSGSRCSAAFKLFALNVHFLCPQTYRSIKSILELPNKNTLSKLKLNIRPEVDMRILNTVKLKLQSLPDAAKHCVLCVDKMGLKRHLYYNIRHDEVIGLQNINGNVTKEIASNAYVVMLRGIAVEWEQPLAYALLASDQHYQELDGWINAVIYKLLQVGVNVAAVVSNQRSSLERYAKEIKGVTAEKPYFEHKERKVYYIFDVPEMLITVRNILLTNDLKFVGYTISWDYIKSLYSYQKEHKLHLIPKVTKSHIYPNKVQKTHVKYAAQVFSRSVYGALNTFIHAKLLPEEARATAEFVKLLNDLFDILNSSTIKSNNKYQRALTLSKDQTQILNAAQNMFKNISVIEKQTGQDKTNKIKTFENFQTSMLAIIELSKCLKEERVDSLLTRRLNQDPIRSFFRTVRRQRKGKRPTAIQFRRAFSKYFIRSMMKSVPSTDNKEDLCDLLLKADKIIRKVTDTTGDPQHVIEPSVAVPLDDDKDYCFDLPTENVPTYVAGYLLFKCSQKHQCREFDSYLRKTPNLCDTNMYVHFKELNKKSSLYGCLKVPPENFMSYVKEMDVLFFNHFEKIMDRSPANFLLLLLKSVKFDPPCPCFPSEYLLRLFVRFRIYAAIKLNNRFFKGGDYMSYVFLSFLM